MTLKQWKEFSGTLKEWITGPIRVEYRCNWHRGHAYKKPNKVQIYDSWWIATDGIRYFSFDVWERRNYKSIVRITKE